VQDVVQLSIDRFGPDFSDAGMEVPSFAAFCLAIAPKDCSRAHRNGQTRRMQAKPSPAPDHALGAILARPDGIEAGGCV